MSRVGHNGTGPEFRRVPLPSLDFSPGLPGSRPRRPRTARPWRLLSAPSPRFPERRRELPPADVDGSRGLAGLCSKGGRHKRARRDFSTRACGGHDRICCRACHAPSGPSRSSCRGNRSTARRSSRGTCSLRRNTHSTRLARHEWRTVSEMSPPFRSACPDSTRLCLKDLPRAIRRVPHSTTLPPSHHQPGHMPHCAQSRASRSVPGKPFNPGQPVCGATGATERHGCWTYLGPGRPRRGSSRACRSSRGPCSRASE